MTYAIMILNAIWGIAISQAALGIICGQIKNGKCGNSLKDFIIALIKKNDVKDYQLELHVHILKSVN